MPKGIFKNPKERAKKISKSLKGHPIYKSKERNNKISKALKGKPSSFKGKKHTEKAKESNRLKHLNKKVTKKQLEALKSGQGWNKGKQNKWMLGENNNSWKGGVTPLMNKIRHSLKYDLWRSAIFGRDDFTCQECGKHGGNLEAHHIIPFSEIITINKINSFEKSLLCIELWDVNNGQTLCNKCHKKYHKNINKKEKDLILGAGEIGSTIYNIFRKYYNIILIDKEPKPRKLGNIRFLHICFPYSEDFVNQVKEYQKIYKPNLTIIHSTTKVGTSRMCDAVHSPVVGLHPFLEKSVLTFTKFIGGDRASEAADYFRRANIKVYITNKQETTELMKIQSTTFYGLCIEFNKDMKKNCDKLDIPFEMWTLWTENYNLGYQKLGFKEFTRPILAPINKKIGGHCIMPNLNFLETPFTNILKKLNK